MLFKWDQWSTVATIVCCFFFAWYYFITYITKRKSKKNSFWYCNYCGERNAFSSGICCNCFKLKTGEKSV